MHMHAKVHKYKQFYIYIPKKCSNVCSTVTDTLERPVVGFLKLANPIKDTCTLSSFFLKDLPCCDTHLRLQIQFHSTLHKTWRAYYQECMKLYGSLDLGCGPKSKPIITIYMCVCCCQSLFGSLRLRGCLQRLNICIAQMTCLKK
jgi:hypothetical protein